MTSTPNAQNQPFADTTSLETVWTAWYNDTARFFVPAFIGRSGTSLLLDWHFEGRNLEAQDWGILDHDGERLFNDPDDIQRSAHETLAVVQHQEPFFDGIEAIVQALCGGIPTDVDVVEVHFTRTKGTVKVQFVLHIGGKSLSKTIQTAKDIQHIRTLMQQDTHA